jgi:hypothetical protein
VDLTADTIKVYSEPRPGGYGRVARCESGGRVVSATLPGFAFDIAEALPPGVREFAPRTSLNGSYLARIALATEPDKG